MTISPAGTAPYVPVVAPDESLSASAYALAGSRPTTSTVDPALAAHPAIAAAMPPDPIMLIVLMCSVGSEIRTGLREANPSHRDVWHLDEVVVSIAGRKHWFWRAVDQDGYVLDEIVQSRRDMKAAKRLLIRLLKKAAMPPKRIITDKLRSDGAAKRDVVPAAEHRSHRGLYNQRKILICRCGSGNARCGVSDQPAAYSGSSRSSRRYEISSSPRITNDSPWPLTFTASAQ